MQTGAGQSRRHALLLDREAVVVTLEEGGQPGEPPQLRQTAQLPPGELGVWQVEPPAEGVSAAPGGDSVANQTSWKARRSVWGPSAEEGTQLGMPTSGTPEPRTP